MEKQKRSQMTIDKMAQANIERYYLRWNKDCVRVSLEDIPDTDWMWSYQEVGKLKHLWKKGMPMVEIAQHLKRSELAVLFQVFDLLYNGKIEKRDWKIW